MPAIDVSQLVVRYGSTTAVDGVSFTAERGEVVALLGPNGAGKTTTVETLEGYKRPSAGAARVAGRMGVMLQRGGAYPSMNARDAVRLFAAYYDDPLPAEEVLDRVGLVGPVAKVAWRRLSGGEQQRLSLALALVGRPEVAFLDEPTAGVDPHGRVVIRDVVRSLASEGACVLLTTHELEEAERVADRVLIMHRGRLVASGPPGELAGGGGVRFGAPPGLDVAALGAALGAVVAEEAPGAYRVVDMASSPRLVAALTAWLAERGVVLSDLRTGETLEDVFLRLTGDDA